MRAAGAVGMGRPGRGSVVSARGHRGMGRGGRCGCGAVARTSVEDELVALFFGLEWSVAAQMSSRIGGTETFG